MSQDALALASLAKKALEGKKCDRCYGSGKVSAYCGECGDSTWDHECPPDVTCDKCGGSGAFVDPLVAELATALDNAAQQLVIDSMTIGSQDADLKDMSADQAEAALADERARTWQAWQHQHEVTEAMGALRRGIARRIEEKREADAALAELRSTIDSALDAVVAEADRQASEREMDVRSGLLEAVGIVRKLLAAALEPKP